MKLPGVVRTTRTCWLPRPDYLELRRLAENLRHIPILALSATCPPKVQSDIIKILGLPPAVSGTSTLGCSTVIAHVEPFAGAGPGKTVFFSSPLYRKNLHYKVVQKPSKEGDHMDIMVNYILEKYPNESGIVYCTTKLVSIRPYLLPEAAFEIHSSKHKRWPRDCGRGAGGRSRQESITQISKRRRNRRCTRCGEKGLLKWFAQRLVGNAVGDFEEIGSELSFQHSGLG